MKGKSFRIYEEIILDNNFIITKCVRDRHMGECKWK